MKTLMTMALGAAAIAAAATPAAAASFNFNFNNGLTGSTSGSGNYMSWSQTVSGETLQVRASAFSLNSTQTAISNATLTRYSAGLGVISSVDGSGANNQHTVDNNGAYDFILLQFSKSVSLGTGVLTPYSVTGTLDNDASVYWGTTAQAWTYDFTSVNFPTFSGAASISGTGSTAPMTLNPTGAFGNLWIVGASFGSTDRDDAFKLNQLRVATAVPEPAAWAMMISGFGLVGGAMRRRATGGGDRHRLTPH